METKTKHRQLVAFGDLCRIFSCRKYSSIISRHIWNFSRCFSICIYLFHGFLRSRTMFSGNFGFHGSLGGKYCR